MYFHQFLLFQDINLFFYCKLPIDISPRITYFWNPPLYFYKIVSHLLLSMELGSLILLRSFQYKKMFYLKTLVLILNIFIVLLFRHNTLCGISVHSLNELGNNSIPQ